MDPQKTRSNDVPHPFVSRYEPWDSSAVQDFNEVVSAHTIGRGQGKVLKLEGEAIRTVLYVVSGWIAVSKSTRDGHRQIVDILLAGDLMNPGSADQDISAVDIEPLSYAKIAPLPRHKWLKLLDDHPALGMALDRNTGAALSRMSERMLRLGKGTAESRIAYAICELCLRSSAAGLIDGNEFHIPMNQQQLGDFTGLSPVHVCRTLRRFKRKGIVKVADHMDISIGDLETLAGIAEIDPSTLRKEIIPAA